MLVNLFKLIIIGLFIYLFYNVYRFVSAIKKNVNNARQRMEDEQRAKMNGSTDRRDESIIELDKDQYHVD